jgi:hypothetical protein
LDTTHTDSFLKLLPLLPRWRILTCPVLHCSSWMPVASALGLFFSRNIMESGNSFRHAPAF